jgi:hypothetical protein
MILLKQFDLSYSGHSLELLGKSRLCLRRIVLYDAAMAARNC